LQLRTKWGKTTKIVVCNTGADPYRHNQKCQVIDVRADKLRSAVLHLLDTSHTSEA